MTLQVHNTQKLCHQSYVKNDWGHKAMQPRFLDYVYRDKTMQSGQLQMEDTWEQEMWRLTGIVRFQPCKPACFTCSNVYFNRFTDTNPCIIVYIHTKWLECATRRIEKWLQTSRRNNFIQTTQVWNRVWRTSLRKWQHIAKKKRLHVPTHPVSCMLS